MGGAPFREERIAIEARIRALQAETQEAARRQQQRDDELAGLRRRLRRLSLQQMSTHARRLSAPALGLVVLASGALGLMGWLSHKPRWAHADWTAQPVTGGVPSPPSLLWRGITTETREHASPPALLDVNGDGVQDAVGFVSPPGWSTPISVAAFSGRDAKVLWQSPELWNDDQAGQTSLIVHGNVVMAAASNGHLHVLSVTDGSVIARTRGQAEFPRVKKLCLTPLGPMADQGKLGALRFDGEQGALVRVEEECAPKTRDDDAHVRAVAPFGARDFGVVAITHVGSSAGGFGRRSFVLGRTGRFEQPEVLAYDHQRSRILWRVRVTGAAGRLAEKPQPHDVFAPGGDCVFVELHPARETEYGPRGTGERQLVCLDATTGQRRWAADHAEHGGHTSSFFVGKTALFWVRHERVDFLDKRDGSSLGHIGWH